jgi:hypothetical protein
MIEIRLCVLREEILQNYLCSVCACVRPETTFNSVVFACNTLRRAAIAGLHSVLHF